MGLWNKIKKETSKAIAPEYEGNLSPGHALKRKAANSFAKYQAQKKAEKEAYKKAYNRQKIKNAAKKGREKARAKGGTGFRRQKDSDYSRFDVGSSSNVGLGDSGKRIL